MNIKQSDYKLVAENITNPQRTISLHEYALNIARQLEKYRRNKFIELFYYGNWARYGYKNRDGADLGLVNILVDYCKGSYEEVDRIFRWSALNHDRDKWETDPGYRDITIRKAIIKYHKLVVF